MIFSLPSTTNHPPTLPPPLFFGLDSVSSINFFFYFLSRLHGGDILAEVMPGFVLKYNQKGDLINLKSHKGGKRLALSHPLTKAIHQRGSTMCPVHRAHYLQLILNGCENYRGFDKTPLERVRAGGWQKVITAPIQCSSGWIISLIRSLKDILSMLK